MVVNMFRLSHSVYNSKWSDDGRAWGLTPSWTRDHINVWTYFLYILKQENLPRRRLGGGASEWDNGISSANFCTVLHRNCGSVLLSFPDTTTGWMDGPALASITYLVLRCTSNNIKVTNDITITAVPYCRLITDTKFTTWRGLDKAHLPLTNVFWRLSE